MQCVFRFVNFSRSSEQLNLPNKKCLTIKFQEKVGKKFPFSKNSHRNEGE